MKHSETVEKPRVYQTGEVATICNVKASRVREWCDEGMLNHYTIPGGSHIRIPHDSLIAFLTKHNMPIPEELQ